MGHIRGSSSAKRPTAPRKPYQWSPAGSDKERHGQSPEVTKERGYKGTHTELCGIFWNISYGHFLTQSKPEGNTFLINLFWDTHISILPLVDLNSVFKKQTNKIYSTLCHKPHFWGSEPFDGARRKRETVDPPFSNFQHLHLVTHLHDRACNVWAVLNVKWVSAGGQSWWLHENVPANQFQWIGFCEAKVT